MIRDLVRLFNYRVEPVPELLLIDADPAVRTGTSHAMPAPGQNDATTDPTYHWLPMRSLAGTS